MAARCFVALFAAALFGAVAADDSAMKYKDMAGHGKAERDQQLSDVSHKMNVLARARQPLNPKVWLEYIKAHPKQAEIVAALVASGVLAHEFGALKELTTRFLQGGAPEEEEAAVELDEGPASETAETAAAMDAVAEEVAEEVEKEAEEAAAEAEEVVKVAEEATEDAKEAVVEATETDGHAADDEHADEHADEHDADSHHDDHHAAGHHAHEHLTFWQAIRRPVNIIKLIVLVGSVAMFYALRKHAHQKAERHLQTHSATTRVVPNANVGGTGGMGV